MRHLKNVRKFNKDTEHRKAMFSNMMTSFFEHERITTTLAKAKELRRLSERTITRAKENTLHNKRMVMRRIHDRDVIAKLFDEIAPKYKEVNGGYTRILKLGSRAGDAADLARIELVDPAESASKKKSKGAHRQAAPKKATGKSAHEGQAAKAPAKAKASRKAAEKKEPDATTPAESAAETAAAAPIVEAPPVAASPAEEHAPSAGEAPASGQETPGSEKPSTST